MPDFTSQFESAEEKISGDTALLILKEPVDAPSAGGPQQSYSLKKVGDAWKLDLGFLDRDAIAAALSKAMKSSADAIRDVTQDVESGKYKTAKEAVADKQERVHAIYVKAKADAAADVPKSDAPPPAN
jgi:hypothetical protein